MAIFIGNNDYMEKASHCSSAMPLYNTRVYVYVRLESAGVKLYIIAKKNISQLQDFAKVMTLLLKW